MSSYKVRIDINLEQYGDLCYIFGLMKPYFESSGDSRNKKHFDLLDLIQKKAECIKIDDWYGMSPPAMLPSEKSPPVNEIVNEIKSENEIKIPEKAHTDVVFYKSEESKTNAYGVGMDAPFSFIERVKQQQNEQSNPENAESNGGVVPTFIAPEKGEPSEKEKKTLYLTTKEVAELLGVDMSAVSHWRSPDSTRQLPCKKVGGRFQYKLSDVTAFQKFWKKRTYNKE
jgi:hypothetical protein